MARNRRKTPPATFVSKTGIEVVENYCRKCRLNKKPTDFYVATDTLLDSNGCMSICKDCIGDLFSRAYQSEHSLEKAIYKICKLLNIKYDERAISSLRSTIEKKEDEGKKFDISFGYYIMRLKAVSKSTMRIESSDTLDLTFNEYQITKIGSPVDEDEVGGIDVKEYLEKSWGIGLEFEDYDFLETEYSKWKHDHKCDTQSEITLIQEICHKKNEIRKKRIMGDSVYNDVKQLQEIMKNSALTPDKQNIASSGRSHDAFGNWVKDIELFKPAEFYEDKEKFKDIDGIEEYGEKYITRSIKNFLTGSRDFTVEELSEIGDLDTDEEE